MIYRLLLPVLLILLALPIESAVAGGCSLPATGTTDLLAIYILAFDNKRTAEIDGFTVDNPLNLTQYYTDTVNNLETASVGLTDRQIIILADLDGPADTHILQIDNGTRTTLDCLPDTNGSLAEIDEYDTTDGETLGGFLQWARATVTANRTVVSYIGHGLAFAPEVGAPHSTLVDEATVRAGGISPLPDRIQVNPDLTDHNLPGIDGSSLITPAALATALAAATSNGVDPVDVLDLTHCFAATLEEMYEVQPYATYTTGSPNYAYYSADMPSTAFANFNPAGPVSNIAETLIDTTQSIINASGSAASYPHALLAFENAKMPAVKNAWDDLSAELLEALQSSPAATLNGIDNAYLGSDKYDTTYCDPADYALAPPDALSESVSFAEQLSSEFPGTPIDDRAQDAMQALFAALPFSQRVGDGTPYFGDSGTPWTFATEPYPGVFTPFDLWQSAGGDFYHTWQSLWYSDTTSYQLPPDVTIENPQPYRFIQGETTWADVVAAYWKLRSERPGVDFDTAICTPHFPTVFDGFTTLRPAAGSGVRLVMTGEPISYTVSIVNAGAAAAVRPFVTHELSPLTELLAAPAFCQVVGNRIGCVPPEPVRGDAGYEFSVLALQPGTAVMTTTASADNALPATTTTATAINGAPLALGLTAAATGSHVWLAPLLTVAVLLTGLLLAGRRRRS